jgi:uncharacterized membrane protein
LRGYFFIASAAFLWGVSAALGRAVFTGKAAARRVAALRPIDPLILSQTRTTFSLLVLASSSRCIARAGSAIKLPARDLAYCFLLGMLGVAVSNYFYYVAIQRTNVATAIIVQYTAPVWVLLYVVARGQQKLTRTKVVAVALAVTGIALVIDLFGATSGGQRFTSIPMASSPRCWPHSLSPSTTSPDTASSRATTAGASSSGLSPPPPLLARRQPSLENRCRPLRTCAMAFLFCFLDDLSAGSVFALLPRPAASGAHARHHRQLPGAGVSLFF